MLYLNTRKRIERKKVSKRVNGPFHAILLGEKDGKNNSKCMWKMENFMFNNSKKIRILKYLWVTNFTHFSIHLSVKLSRNSRENKETFA